jgi:hypothetical protein
LVAKHPEIRDKMLSELSIAKDLGRGEAR